MRGGEGGMAPEAPRGEETVCRDVGTHARPGWRPVGEPAREEVEGETDVRTGLPCGHAPHAFRPWSSSA